MVGLGTVFLHYFDFMVYVLSEVGLVLTIIDTTIILYMAFRMRMDPRTFVTWLMVMLFIPFIGIFLFIFIGCTRYDPNRFVVEGYSEEDMSSVYDEEERSIGDPDPLLDQMMHAMHRIGGWGYSDNNTLKLITKGEIKMDMILEDISNAKEFILFQYYIIRDDVYGNRLMDVLIDKVKEGVTVYLLTDSFGNGKGPKDAMRRFRDAGGHIELFHVPIRLAMSPKKNHRNHRKIAVIDGKVAYCGGFNIGKEYVSQGRFGYWRDASFRLEGSVIDNLTIRVIADWNYASKKDRIADASVFMRSYGKEHAGHDRVQAVSGGPDHEKNNPIALQYAEMCRSARKVLYITTPYLCPNDVIMENIKCAALAGVDVRIMVPAVGDHIFVHWNTLTAANELMKFGVRVYLHQNGFNHAKIMICDDQCLSVGSANLDDRSMSLNFETNIVVYSKELRDEMYEVFMHDIEYSSEYSCDEYDSMPPKFKRKCRISYLFRYIS